MHRLWLLALCAIQTLAQSDSPTNRLDLLGSRHVRVHDPSTIVRDRDEYWIFYTGRGTPSFRSKDLFTWTAGPRIFTNAPPWVQQTVPNNRGGLDYWAPDVIKVRDRFFVYYSVSSFGKNTSAIALATNKTLDPESPDFKWSDEGVVFQTSTNNNFNAIDPSITFDQEGKLWMTFGSFWSGIKLVQLDATTGKMLGSGGPIHAIAKYESIEAPYIYHHDTNYYLFVNWGRCCRGTNSTYNIRIGRSPKITGPYLDKDGKDLAQGGGSLLLETDGPYIGPGHAGIYKEGERFWFSHHFYDATQRGASTLSIRPLTWATDGWPIVQ
jgi:arabinan endo-1,5-alpha-L-arabinosidase